MLSPRQEGQPKLVKAEHEVKAKSGDKELWFLGSPSVSLCEPRDSKTPYLRNIPLIYFYV